MEVLITGSDAPLASSLLEHLARRHRVRTLGSGARGDRHIDGDLRDEAVAQQAASGIDCIVHLAPVSPTLGELAGGEALDWIGRGTFNLYHAAIEAGVSHVVQASTLDFFSAYPTDSRPGPLWRPLPDTSIPQLAAYLAERSAWEFSGSSGLPILVVRTGAVTAEGNQALAAATAIHPEDAVAALGAAVDAGPQLGHSAFSIAHAVGRGEAAVGLGDSAQLLPGYEPRHPVPRVNRPIDRTEVRDITPRGWLRVGRSHWPGLDAAVEGDRRPRAVLFGAGGPLLSAAAQVAGDGLVMRLTDLVPLAEAAQHPQKPNAPVPGPVTPPHEERLVDVTDPDQVRQACRDMDVIINGTVVRQSLEGAFRVNLMGCYHVLTAALDEGIRRIVHSGPQMVSRYYTHDYDIPSGAPLRPRIAMYSHSKYLSFELCKVFSEEHDLTIPTITFAQLRNAQQDDPWETAPIMSVSWRDAGRATWAAARVPDENLPAPFTPLHIMADMPHGRAHSLAARRILGWEPEDGMTDFWRYH